MTTYYVDPAASGSNDGSSWTDAWTDFQSAATNAVAGDTVYMRGSQTPSAAITFANPGDLTSGLIKYIGVNSSGVNDGTRFELDGGSTLSAVISQDGKNYLWFENIEVYGATGYGWTGTADNSHCVYINVCCNNNGGAGFNTDKVKKCVFILCTAYSNSSRGFGASSGNNNSFFYCVARDNSLTGFAISSAEPILIGCISYNNAQRGIEGLGDYGIAYNCVIEANGDHSDEGGIESSFGGVSVRSIIGCRITNHSTTGEFGIDANSTLLLHGWNYFEDNDTNITSATYAFEIKPNGISTDQADQADTNEGYVDNTAPGIDLNLASGSTMGPGDRTAIQLNWS